MKHSHLSPSGAHRWLNCTASTLYSSHGTGTVYSEEGTLAHKLAEKVLRGGFTQCVFPNEEMRIHIGKYIQYVWGIRLNCSQWGSETYVPIDPIMGGGTCDFWAIENDILHVVDFKYGTARVFAKDNEQLILYAYGLTVELGLSPVNVKLHIVQPRTNKQGEFDQWEITYKDIVSWIKSVLCPKVHTIVSGKVTHSPGTWCWFCPGKGQCPELLLRQIRKDFMEDDSMNGKFITKKKLQCMYTSLGKKVPRMQGSDDLEFQISIIVPKDDTETIGLLQDAYDEAYKKGKEELWLGKKPTPGKFELSSLLKEVDYEWAENCYLLKLKSNKDQIGVVNMEKELIPGGSVKNGDWVQVSGYFMPYNNQHAKGIGCYLSGVLFVDVGEPIAGGIDDPIADFFPEG